MITLISPSQSAIDPGLRTISSYLKTNGYEVRLIFLKKRFEKIIHQDAVEQIAQLSENSIFIGITLMTHEFLLCANLTQMLKKVTKTFIIWGGPHPMIRPEECLQYCDYVCTGEGKSAILEFANRIRASENPTDTICLFRIIASGIIISSRGTNCR